MFLVLKKDGIIRDAKESMRGVYIPAGRYQVERIASPEGTSGFWLVLNNTEIGAPENVIKNSNDLEEKLVDWGGTEALLIEDV
mgnify:CR=1 FL=1